MIKMAAGTYVQISRDDLEAWLDSFRSDMKAKWERVPNRAGVYLLPVGDNVAVKLSSTIGSNDDAMGRGEASMQLSLVSAVTGQVLNKKAQGQNHFARTTNWKKNWKEGFSRVKEAYMKAQGFYDALALIEDRRKYQQDTLKRIESIVAWEQSDMLRDFHARLKEGGILTVKQFEVIIHLEQRGTAEKKPAGGKPDDALLERLRKLYQVAKQRNDNWLTDFLTSVGQQVKAGRPMTEKQQAVVEKNFQRYRV